MKKTLSIIVPVYNTSKYIRKCLDSLVNQTLKDLEIIIINDCSTDDSEKIILDYCESYGSKIIYKKLSTNHGVGYARKIGSEIASGEYIAFIDSDDWVELNFYELLLNSIVENNSDVAVASAITEFNNSISSQKRYIIPYDDTIDSCFALKVMSNYYQQNFYISPNMNNRLYKKSIIVNNDLCRENSKQAQDNYSSFMLFVHAKKVSLVSNAYYHYYQRDSSAVHSFSFDYINNYFNVLNNIKDSLIQQKIFEQYRDVFISFVDRSLIWINKCLKESNSTEALKKSYIKQISKRSLELFSLDEYIEYFDSYRLMKIFAS